MKEVRIYQMDAFTHIPFGGNPAGVVPDADGLTDEEMQQIAREMNVSETAFVCKSERPGADVRVRFFTPTEEIDLCGHATISTFVVLGLEERFGSKLPLTVVQETNVGLLPVMISRDGEGRIQAFMTQAAPAFASCDLNREDAAKLLGLAVDDIDPNLPIGLAYTGLWDLFVPIVGVEPFERMQPDLAAITTLNKSLGVASTHCYSLSTSTPQAHLHTRDFSPAVGIPEDPATGTANGALGAFLLHHGIFQPERENVRLLVEQGFEINRPSYLHVEVDGEPRSPRTVRVGGTAVPILQGTMRF
ncbi:PhzF family phenazine biosynthesis protein [Tumebacillus sp. ITR2]|uniref:PhzF family phenazine biosynthesis protein n=1 Tax=Tumebacillus amylolyticus TaxID=2801339 RepID=A0ABS1JE64_9BACL|nr:PhzF family phenazine biosynthesis protein [Tumebacillus amylolyticus]MBL0388505.1 PhzF family phenazine biosynthesis protein [Tumebacillus amylolyticus]